MMIATMMLCCIIVSVAFTTNVPPRSTFIGSRTLATYAPASTSLFMNIETVATKENIRVGVIGM
jgi:hypothetical protein